MQSAQAVIHAAENISEGPRTRQLVRIGVSWSGERNIFSFPIEMVPLCSPDFTIKLHSSNKSNESEYI